MASDNDQDTDTSESEDTQDTSSDASGTDQNIDLGNLNDSSGVKDDFQVQISGEPVPDTQPQSDDQ
jgi:hypothetical protein